jgi:hypothetical protein
MELGQVVESGCAREDWQQRRNSSLLTDMKRVTKSTAVKDTKSSGESTRFPGMWHTKLNNVMLSKLPTLYRRLQEKRYNIC